MTREQRAKIKPRNKNPLARPRGDTRPTQVPPSPKPPPKRCVLGRRNGHAGSLHAAGRDLHTFRRSISTWLIDNDENAKATQELLRHANSKTTLDVYAKAATRSSNIPKQLACSPHMRGAQTIYLVEHPGTHTRFLARLFPSAMRGKTTSQTSTKTYRPVAHKSHQTQFELPTAALEMRMSKVCTLRNSS